DVVERRLVAVLARHRHLAGEALGLERRDDATGHAVVLGENVVDLVVVRGQDAFHVGLRDVGLPAVGVFLADDLDLPGLHGVADDLVVAAAQEAGVVVGLVALDDRVVAFGLGLQDLAGLHAADLGVVEGQVQDLGILDQPVVRDDRDALAGGLGDRRQDRDVVLGQDDDHLGAARDQALDVGGLGLGGRLGVVRDVLPAAILDGLLEGGLIPLRPSLFLVVVPGHADGAVGGGGAARRPGRCATAVRRARTENDRGDGCACGEPTNVHARFSPPPMTLTSSRGARRLVRKRCFRRVGYIVRQTPFMPVAVFGRR